MLLQELPSSLLLLLRRQPQKQLQLAKLQQRELQQL